VPRRLIFITVEKIKIPACDSCGWYFMPECVEGDSLEAMLQAFREQMKRDFAVHDCNNYPNTKKEN
jgi:hypothetical protein